MKISRVISVNLGAVIILLMLAVFVAFSGTAHCDERPDLVKDYDAAVTRLKNGDTSVDYEKMRYSFTLTNEYNPYGRTRTDRDAMFKAMAANKYEVAIKHAQAVLEKNYVDMDAHFISTLSYQELGNASKQAFHAAVLKGLIGSLYRSGDGQSPESAYVVISTDEEYFMLHMNGYKTMQQALVEKGGMSFDRMEVEKTANGEKSTIYFNVTFPYRWLKWQLKKK